MKRMKKIIVFIICLASILMIFKNNMVNALDAFENGIYNVSYEIGGQSGIGVSMISRYIDKNIVLEKIDNHYYISVTQLSSSMENLMIDYNNGMQVGYEITDDSKSNKTYRFTIEEDRLESDLPFSVYVSARGETYSFSIKLNLSSKVKVSDNIDNSNDRPAEFVPVLSTTAGNYYEFKVGTTFVIPVSTASLGENNLAVDVKAYYNDEEYTFSNNKITLNNVGMYKLVYSASSSAYKTLLGNDTTVIKEISIKSTTNGSSIAKVNDINSVLPENSSIMASRIISGNVYDNASNLMKNIADNYEVYDIDIIDSDGNSVMLSKDVEISIKVSNKFDRNKIKAYVLSDDNKLKELSVSNGGSYSKLLTSETGTFIICVPGVAFHMPIWGYILIVVGAVILIAGLVSSIIIIRRKHKKALAI